MKSFKEQGKIDALGSLTAAAQIIIQRKIKMNKKNCRLCGKEGEFSMPIVISNSEGKVHLPVDPIGDGLAPILTEIIICKKCLNKIDKSLNKKINKIMNANENFYDGGSLFICGGLKP